MNEGGGGYGGGGSADFALCFKKKSFFFLVGVCVEGEAKARAYVAFGLAFFLPLRSRLGIERVERPNSAAIPSSRRPRKSSPISSVNWPLQLR